MQIGWVDFSPEERRRTLLVLNSLTQSGAVDEIGIGVARDAIADFFFPGTSTLLTRARYFFLVPYISRFMEREHDSDKKEPNWVKARFSKYEEECARGLVAQSEDKEGIIGRNTLQSKKWVVRGPGEIYWASLRALGFIMREQALMNYSEHFKYLSEVRSFSKRSSFERKDDGLADDNYSFSGMWRLPAGCYEQWVKDWGNWSERASISLTKQEAEFLRKQIIDNQHFSLFSMILEDELLRGIAIGTYDGMGENGPSDQSFHNFLIKNGGLERIRTLDSDLAYACELANDFSEFVLGCRIAYNMQLFGQEEKGAAEWEDYRGSYPDVASKVRLDELGVVFGISDHPGFLSMKQFLEQAAEKMALDDLSGLKNVVKDREREIKRSRRKIGRTDQGKYSWRGGMHLPYRFSNAMRIVREIWEAGGCDA